MAAYAPHGRARGVMHATVLAFRIHQLQGLSAACGSAPPGGGFESKVTAQKWAGTTIS